MSSIIYPYISMSYRILDITGDIIYNVIYVFQGGFMTEAKTVPASQATRITIRLPHTLAEALRRAADENGVSVNQYILYLLARRIQ